MGAFIETVSQILIDWGYPDLFISALLAGNTVPFGPEVVLLGLVKLGLDPILRLISTSLGNTAGEMTCCYMGRLDRVDWIKRYSKVKKEKIDKMQRFLRGRGALMTFFAFLPAIDEMISMALGFMRSNVWLTTVSMFAGKLIRYIILLKATQEALNLVM